MKFKSALVTQVSGSVGGMTGSHNRGGMYFRSRAIPTDPLSTMQQAMRMYLGMLSTYWGETLTAAEQEAWNLYAANVTVIGPLGDPITLSGQMHFIRSNTARLQAGLSQIDAAPTTFNTGETPMVSSVAYSNVVGPPAGTQLDITFTSITTGVMLIRIGRPQGAGIGFFKGPFRYQTHEDTSPFSDLQDVWPDMTAGQKVWTAFRNSFDDGRLSEQVIVGPSVVT